MRLLGILLLLLPNLMAYSQDSTFIKLMMNNTYEFDIENGKLIGEGADFLKEEFKQSQYILLGEYHDSPQVSNFTWATIRTIDDYGFKTIGLEVGANAIQNLIEGIGTNSKNNAYQRLSVYHNKYSFLDEDNERYTTIPFLDFMEDANFLNELVQKKWNIMGLDQEYMHGLVPAIDILYDNLSDPQKQTYKDLKTVVQDSVRSYDIQSINGISNLFEKLSKDSMFHKFMRVASQNDKNKNYINEIYASIEIYSLAMLDHKYYQAYIERLKYFKKALNKQMIQHGFDLKNDKMLLKYGGLHTAKGTSKAFSFDIGNTLNELAEFHQNKSLHIYFKSRFHKSDEEIEDKAKNEKNKYYELIKLGKKEKWVAIDLRKARDKSLFYPFIYNLNDDYKQLILNQDILIIPSMDYDGEMIK